MHNQKFTGNNICVSGMEIQTPENDDDLRLVNSVLDI